MITADRYATIALDIIAASQAHETIAVGDIIMESGQRGLLSSAHPLMSQAIEYVDTKYPRPWVLEDTSFHEVSPIIPEGQNVAIAAVYLVAVWHDPDGTVRMASTGGDPESVMGDYFAGAAELQEVCQAELLSRRIYTPPPPHTRLPRRYPRCATPTTHTEDY